MSDTPTRASEAHEMTERVKLLRRIVDECTPDTSLHWAFKFCSYTVADLRAALAPHGGATPASEPTLSRSDRDWIIEHAAELQHAQWPLVAEQARIILAYERQLSPHAGTGEPRAWWMIEWPHHGAQPAMWWAGHREDPLSLVWTDDNTQAVWFNRQSDAENTLRIFRHYIAKLAPSNEAYAEMIVTGHMNPLYPPPAPALPTRTTEAEAAPTGSPRDITKPLYDVAPPSAARSDGDARAEALAGALDVIDEKRERLAELAKRREEMARATDARTEGET